MRVLWISRNVPYDDVAHAGGKIHNYLLKSFKKNGVDCFLISFAKEEEFCKIDLDKYNIPYDIAKISFRKNLSYLGKKLFSLLFVFTYFLGMDTFWYVWRIFRSAQKYKRRHENPDVVILQWTSVVNQIWWLKKLFPESKFVTIEEDVTFLKKERMLKKSSYFIRMLKKPFFVLFKKNELHSLKLSELVVLNNEKDRDLIVDEGVSLGKTFVCHPFFQDMLDLEHYGSKNHIIFYGAMNRPENYKSAIWFIEKVFIPKLIKKGFCFTVVGNKPHESLKKYDNGDNIRIVGFVEDVSPYFQNSLCLVAPLVMGAGVKIKVIEAMSAGLPVLTNEIGIEGIFAEKEKDFFYCVTPEDYEKKIVELSNNVKLCITTGMNAKNFVKNNFNYAKDAEMLFKKNQEIIGE